MVHSLYANPIQSGGNARRAEADRLVADAKLQPLTDGGTVTSRLLLDALKLDPHHHEARVFLERLHQMAVPRWHFPMLADTKRNKAYSKAIEATVKPGDVVLDIGCGAGLTAMLAARAGAKHVYTCEQQPLIASAARQVIAENGLSDRITVITKWSHEIRIGVDMPEPADVVVSEIVDSVLLGEGALAALTLAMNTLAKPGARAIPEHGKLLAQSIESRALYDTCRPQEAEGFQLGQFHRFSNVAQLTPSDFEAFAPRPLGRRAELFRFDFVRPNVDPAEITRNLFCTETGTIHAVLVTFEMQLCAGITLDNGVASGGHWGRVAFLLEQPAVVKIKSLLEITAQHDASNLTIAIAGIVSRALQSNPLQRRSSHEAAPPDTSRVVKSIAATS